MITRSRLRRSDMALLDLLRRKPDPALDEKEAASVLYERRSSAILGLAPLTPRPAERATFQPAEVGAADRALRPGIEVE